ncbi:hypothetical protein [Coleofasciculus sp. E2-BRE-01]|uniref:hypothetical protein n=1 Tax=Coleofasciculus sp. E2-BRE-01 TaxID=3069524 RepID=UPI0032FD7032
MEWKWSKANEKDLARFVTEDSVKLLDKLPVDDRLKLLQEWDGRRALVKAIYETLVSRGITYALEKYHPEDEIQQIRTPSEILSNPGEGTCLDLAILFCGLCFGYDLLPLLVVIEGHALAAVSLNEQRKGWNSFARERGLFNKPELFQGEESLVELKKLIEDDAYIAVECTGFAHTQSFGNSQEPEAIGRNSSGFLSFDKALSAGKKQLSNPNRAFKFAIDIATAKYFWKMESLQIPNLNAAEVNPKALFNVDVEEQQGGEITGVKADRIKSRRDIESNVKLGKGNQTVIRGGDFGEL